MRRIVNTSPLILLSKIGLVDLLRAGDLPVIVPQAVLDEIARHGPEDQSLLLVRSAGWLQVAPDLPIPPQLDANRLGAGELAVLALALAQPGSEVVLDDLTVAPLCPRKRPLSPGNDQPCAARKAVRSRPGRGTGYRSATRHGYVSVKPLRRRSAENGRRVIPSRPALRRGRSSIPKESQKPNAAAPSGSTLSPSLAIRPWHNRDRA